MKIKITENQKTIFIVLFCILLIVLPLFLRLTTGNLPVYGSEQAYTTRILTQNIQHDPIQQRDLSFNLYFWILKKINFDSLEFVSKVLPTIFGILTFIIYALILKKEKIKHLATLLLAGSPAFIFLFSTFTFQSFAIFLFFLGLYLFLQKKGWISFIVFSIIPLVDFFYGVITLLFLLIYSLFNKYKLSDFYIVLVAVLATSSIILSTNIINIFHYIKGGTLITTLAEFGAFAGLTLPLIILAFIGIFLNWEKNRLKIMASTFFIILLVFSIISAPIKIFFVFILPYFGAIAIKHFSDRKWSIPILKNITLLLIFCSLLFPLVAFYDAAINQPPNLETIEALQILNEESAPGSVVLSSEENGFFIQKYSNRTTYLDSLSSRYPYYEQKIENYNTVLFSRNLENTTAILDKNHIKYFYIDSEMKEKYWNNKEEGLMFLLKTSHVFLQIYDSENIDIFWYLLDEEQI